LTAKNDLASARRGGRRRTGGQPKTTGYIPSRDRIKGLAALEALEASGRLFCYPADVANVIDKDLKTIHAALSRGEIPHTRIGQRYHISIAWLRRQVDGLGSPQADQGDPLHELAREAG
jgi:hypothetical protein